MAVINGKSQTVDPWFHSWFPFTKESIIHNGAYIPVVVSDRVVGIPLDAEIQTGGCGGLWVTFSSLGAFQTGVNRANPKQGRSVAGIAAEKPFCLSPGLSD